MKIPQALLKLVKQFDQANIDYRIGGGQAAVYYGLREEAGDWDIAVAAITPELKQILEQAGFTEIADSNGLSWEGPILIDFIIADGEAYPTLTELGMHIADLKLKFPKRSMMGYINWKKGESAYQHLKDYKNKIEKLGVPKQVEEYLGSEPFRFASAENSMLGPCLRKALEEIKQYPTRKLLMGPPGQEGDTAHFWTEEDGQIYDNASDCVSQNYSYQGRIVDPEQVLKELREGQLKGRGAKAQSSDFSQSDIEKSMEDRENPIEGGVGDDLTLQDVDVTEFLRGVETEMEHVKGSDLPLKQQEEIAADIAFDHLDEIDDYYTRLTQMENEAKNKDHITVAKLASCLTILASRLDAAGSVIEASLMDRLVGEECLVAVGNFDSLTLNKEGKEETTIPSEVFAPPKSNEWQAKANTYRKEFLIEKILEKATGVAPATIRYYKTITPAVEALGKLLDAVETLDRHSQKYIDVHRYVQNKYNSIYDPYNTDHVPNKINFIRELLKVNSLVESNIDRAAKPEMGSNAIVEAFVDQLKDKGYVSELNKLKKFID